MSDDLAIQPDDDLSKPPKDLNDFHAWLARDNLPMAFEALLNKAAIIVGYEQTSQMLVKQLREEQDQRDEALARRMERFLLGFKTDLNRTIGAFEEQTVARLDAYGQQIDALSTLLEERTAPFSEFARRVETLEYGYAELATRLDAALDPTTPGATIEIVQIQDRVATLTRLILALFVSILALAGLLVWHHYYLWERLQ